MKIGGSFLISGHTALWVFARACYSTLGGILARGVCLSGGTVIRNAKNPFSLVVLATRRPLGDGFVSIVTVVFSFTYFTAAYTCRNPWSESHD